MSESVELTPVYVAEPVAVTAAAAGAPEAVNPTKLSKRVPGRAPRSLQSRAGLSLSVTRVYRRMCGKKKAPHVGKKARVMLAAALNFILGNIMEDAYTASRQRGLRARHVDEVLGPHLPLAQGSVVVVRGANRKTHAFNVGHTRYINERRGKAKESAA